MGIVFEAEQQKPKRRVEMVRDRRRRVLGGDHPPTISALSNIGCLSQQRGKLDEAEPCFLARRR